MGMVRRALLLSVGYGDGHNAAAAAVAQELQGRGWDTLTVDPCREAHPFLFALTRHFYQFCVRRAPWLWGVTYAQTDTANWAEKSYAPVLRDVTEVIAARVHEFSPEIVVCTYPLFAHMLDALREAGRVLIPYLVVVTDSLEISRPWMVTKAPLVCLPDEYSLKVVTDRYAPDPQRLKVTGFPVRREFADGKARRTVPTPQTLRLVYGAYAPLPQVRKDLELLKRNYPLASITVIAGDRCNALTDLAGERVDIIRRTDRMSELFAESHLYIGKAGAATMFEAYASGLPVVVNYALPGQEQGNLALLLQDGAGVEVRSSADLLVVLGSLLANGAVGWRRLQNAMALADRGRGAGRIADIIEHERHF